jgi:Tol biopolymer transport system component
MQVTPGSATLYPSESVALSVLLRDQSGQEIPHADSTSFVSSSDQVAMVDTHGLVTPTGLGQASITVSATLNGLTKRLAVPITVARPAGRLAFSYTFDASIAAQIYTSAPDGTDIRQVTTGPRSADHPSWSPDGARIVFDRAVSDTASGIFVVNADGSNAVEIAASGNSPTWLPDGRIAFMCSAGVCVTDANGANARTLIPRADAADAFDYDFTWSPDGSMVAFTHESDITGDPWNQVYVMNADGSGVRRLTATPGPQFQESSPRWSPDGKRIVLWNGGYGVSVIDANGSNFHFISSYRGLTARPAWSPDGTHIVLGTELDHFFVANADGVGAIEDVHTALSPGANSPYGGWWAWSSR